jgi:hypothetical protein
MVERGNVNWRKIEEFKQRENFRISSREKNEIILTDDHGMLSINESQ